MVTVFIINICSFIKYNATTWVTIEPAATRRARFLENGRYTGVYTSGKNRPILWSADWNERGKRFVGRGSADFPQNLSKISERCSDGSLLILCQWSADVLPVSARVSHHYLTSRGARPIFGWKSVSVEASPGTGRSTHTHWSRQTCRFSAFSVSFHITLKDEESQCTERSKWKKRCSWYRHGIKNSEIETQAGECTLPLQRVHDIWPPPFDRGTFDRRPVDRATFDTQSILPRDNWPPSHENTYYSI